MKKKVSLIGAGNIGGTLAQLVSQSGIADVIMYDLNGNMAKGKALDIMQMNTLSGINSVITGSSDIKDIADSDVIVVTAGVPRRLGGTRDELISTNAKIIYSIAGDVKKHSPNAFVVVVTNPLDAMVCLFQQASGLPVEKVVGMAGMLDTARFKLFLAQEFNVSSADIGAVVLGGHGDSMVPVIGSSTISGIRINDLIKSGRSSEQKIASIIARTRVGGGEIVNLLSTGSAFYAPAMSAMQMVMPYLLGDRKMLTGSVYLNGQYGVNGLYVGVPIIIGKNGVEDIIELDLSNDEQEMFNKSVDIIRSATDIALLANRTD
ncbi:MAG: malate dehydrogenase [Alphaproteobacteria bacterium]|nr:malate dehydrogenase [Rickettsiales bacterium]